MLDTLIVAQALSLRWTLATHNVREVRRVPGARGGRLAGVSRLWPPIVDELDGERSD